MKKLIYIIIAGISFLTFYPAAVSAAGNFDGGYEYNGYTEPLAGKLPSEQSYAEIQQMSDYNQNYDRELRDKPGGGPGLGEISVPLESTATNILVLTFSCIAVIILKKRKTKK